MAQVVRREGRRPRALHAACRRGGQRRVQGRHIRPRDRGREDRLLEVPQRERRLRAAQVRARDQEGRPREGGRRVLRLLPALQPEHVQLVEPHGLRARLRLARHRLRNHARQLQGPRLRRRHRHAARAGVSRRARKAPLPRDRLLVARRPPRREELRGGILQDRGGRPRRPDARGGVRDRHARLVLVVRHVGRLLRLAGALRAHREARADTPPLCRRRVAVAGRCPFRGRS